MSHIAYAATASGGLQLPLAVLIGGGVIEVKVLYNPFSRGLHYYLYGWDPLLGGWGDRVPLLSW